MSNTPFSEDDITRAIEALRDFADNYDEYGNELTTEQKAIRDYDRKLAAEQKKNVEKWQKRGNVATDLAKSLTTADSAFDTMGSAVALGVKAVSGLLGSAVPVIGGILQGLGEAAAKAVELLTKETGKAFTAFSNISGTGVVKNFENLREVANATGLTFDQISGVLGKNSEGLAAFGGSALEGSIQLRKILETNKKYSIDMQKFGITRAEFSEITANYISRLSRAGLLQNRSDKQLAASAKEFTERLVILTQLTGKTRKELQDELNQANQNARYRALMIELRLKGEDGKADLYDEILNRLDKSMQPMFIDLFASMGGITTEATNALVASYSAVGVDITKYVNQVGNGQIKTADEFIEKLSLADRKVEEGQSKIVSIVGAEGASVLQFYVAQANSAKNAGKKFSKISQGLIDYRELQKDTEDPAAMAMISAQNIASQMQIALTNTDKLMAANNFAGEQIEKVVKQLNKFTGAAAEEPPWTRPTTAVPGKERIESTGGTGGSVNSLLDFIGKYESNGNYNILVGGKTAPLTTMTVGEVLEYQRGMRRRGHESTAVGKYQIIRDTLLDIMKPAGVKLEDKFDQSTQDKLAIALLERSGLTQYQNKKISQEQFADQLASTWAALPKGSGLSAHQGVGSNRALVGRSEFLAAIPKYARGGLVGPTSGNLLSQSLGPGESGAVVPLPDGRTIPVIIRNTDQHRQALGKIFDRLNSQFDEMIEIITKDNNYRYNIVQNTA